MHYFELLPIFIINMRDRTLGYYCLSIPLILLVVAICLHLCKKNSGDEFRIIRFRNVTGLNFITKQDPVLIRGLKIGYVKSIAINDRSVYITIHTKKPLQIFQDYNITVGALGVMGSRFLNIDPGISTNSPVPATSILTGTLLASPPDAVAEMGQLIAVVKELNSISDGLLNGTQSEQSFITSYKKLISTFNISAEKLTRSSKELVNDVSYFLDTMNILLERGFTMNTTLKQAIPELISAADTVVATASDLTIQLNALIVNSETIITNYKDYNFSGIRNSLNSLHANVCSLQVIVKAVREKGLYLPVRLW